MNRTSIEWVKNPDGSQGYTHNPMSGCQNHTPEGLCLGGLFPCYAFKLAHGRLKQRYLANTILPSHDEPNHQEHHCDPFYPRFWEERLKELSLLPSPDTEPKRKGIFVCDMGDLFGIGVPEEWTREVIEHFKWNPQHHFYLLTKQPQNLIKFNPFPDNALVGVTATRRSDLKAATYHLERIQAKVKYLSLEPLLEEPPTATLYTALYQIKLIDWLIIGACTGTYRDMMDLCLKYPELLLMPSPDNNKWLSLPPIEWVKEIVEAADKAGIKVFLKDNLKPLIDKHYPNENSLVPNHNSLVRMEHPKLCPSCIGRNCDACGVIWGLRQEIPSIVRIPQFSQFVE